jgi:hypothetical protein
MAKSKKQQDEELVIGDEAEVNTEEEAPKKASHKAKIPNRVDITIDTSPEDVVQYDNERKNLIFSGEPGKFLELPDEVIDQLSSRSKQAYFSAYGLHEWYLKNAAEDRVSDRIKVSPRLATATAQLEVTNKDPRMHYCWKRTDEKYISERDGYRVASDPALKTFRQDADTTVRTVGSDGETELILMKIPKEDFEAQQRAISEKSRRRIEGADNQAKEEIRRAGGVPYEEKPGPGGPNFTPTRGEA